MWERVGHNLLNMMEKTDTETYVESFENCFKLMAMRPISTRKHEWNVGSMVPTSTRQHGMEFKQFWDQ